MLQPRGFSVETSCYILLLSTSTSTDGSFENEALENEDRSTKHPNLENEAPKISKTKHSKLENEDP